MGDGDFSHQQPDERGSMTPSRFVFLRPRTWILVRHTEPQTHLHWSPRIHLQVLKTVLERQRELMERLIERPAKAQIRRQEEMTLRMVRQGTRVENPGVQAGAGGGGLLAGQAGIPAIPDVPRMLVRQGPRNIEATAAAPPNVPVGAATASLFTPRTPGIDVNRIAEQVIDTIDHRLRAHRERIGKR